MKASIKGNVLTVEVPILTEPKPSKSGKNVLLATSGGNQAVPLTINGQPKVVKIGLNAFMQS